MLMNERLLARDLETDAVAKAYDRWAPIYDLVFGRVFARGRRAAVEAANHIGGAVLEVGVGTGLSLPSYGRGTRVVGIDISEPMLAIARARVRRLGLVNVDGLSVMDAERLEFADASFDVVVAQYVVTAVSKPELALDEFARVLRPGGAIILTSRVGAEGGFRAHVERLISPLVTRLGWRSEFPFARYVAWAERSGIAIVERLALPPLGHFSLLRMARIVG